MIRKSIRWLLTLIEAIYSPFEVIRSVAWIIRVETFGLGGLH